MTHQVHLHKLLQYFENISPPSVLAIIELYDSNAYFKDPFNEVHGHQAIMKIFQHMFKQVETPRFVICQTIQQEADAISFGILNLECAELLPRNAFMDLPTYVSTRKER